MPAQHVISQLGMYSNLNVSVALRMSILERGHSADIGDQPNNLIVCQVQIPVPTNNVHSERENLMIKHSTRPQLYCKHCTCSNTHVSAVNNEIESGIAPKLFELTLRCLHSSTR